MSGMLMKRTWLSGVALVAVFGFAACSDDDDSGNTPTAGTSGSGSGGKSSGGSAGSTHAGDGGTPAASGTANGGKGGNVDAGGKAGTSTGGGTVGGTNMGPGGEGGVGGLGGLGGIGGAGGEGGTVEVDLRTYFVGMSPLPAVPADPTNKYADDAAAAALGQKFFFDEKFSGAMTVTNDLGNSGDVQKVSCKSCHSGPALDDERSLPDAAISKGTGNHTRNAPGMVNSSFYTWTNWGGRFAAQWELPPAVVENPAIMNSTRLAVAHRIYDAYKTEYEAVFGALDAGLATTNGRFPASGKPTQAAFDNMAGDDKTIVNGILVNFGKALEAYTRKLVSREAKFDAWFAGDDGVFDASQLNGARLFVDKGCINCHGGAHFSDHSFHKLGVPVGVSGADDGRGGPKDLAALLVSPLNINSVYSDKQDTGKLDGLVPADYVGKFRTPSLRGVVNSGPYMHAGQFATLEQVIDFYAVGGTLATGTGELVPFAITPQEKADLIAFLGTLSGKPVPDALLLDNAPD